MKYKSLPTVVLLTTSFALLAFTACSKSTGDKIADTTKDVYHDTKDAVAKGWDNLKAFTFEKRGDFTAEVKAKQAAFEAEVSKLRAAYSDAKAGASRKAAMNDLKDSETDYKEKLAAL